MPLLWTRSSWGLKLGKFDTFLLLILAFFGLTTFPQPSFCSNFSMTLLLQIICWPLSGNSWTFQNCGQKWHFPLTLRYWQKTLQFSTLFTTQWNSEHLTFIFSTHYSLPPPPPPNSATGRLTTVPQVGTVAKKQLAAMSQPTIDNQETIFFQSSFSLSTVFTQKQNLPESEQYTNSYH